MKTKMKAYIRYGANGTIISGVLVKSSKKPTGSGWVEVSMTYCCPSATSTVSNSKNRAFIKYAGNTVIPGSTIIRKNKPSSGTWVEVPYQQCCEPSGLVTMSVVLSGLSPELLNLALLLVDSNSNIVGQVTPVTEGLFSFTVPNSFTGSLQFGGSNEIGSTIIVFVEKNGTTVTDNSISNAANFGYAYPITEGEVAQFNITILPDVLC